LIQAMPRLYPQHEFVLAIREGSENDPEIRKTIGASMPRNVSVVVVRGSRRLTNVKCLLRLTNYARLDVEADAFLNFDLDYLGPRARPLIVTVGDLSSLRSETSSLDWLGRRMRRHALRVMSKRADCVVAVSHHTRLGLEKYERDLTGRITVIYNGIDPAWHAQEIVNTDAANPYWIWWGHISRRKNLNRLLIAYSKIARRQRRCPELMVVAERANVMRELGRTMATLNLRDRIKIIPPVPVTDLVRLVDGSAGLVFPSLHEGFGLPIVEALARGKPVLTSSVTSMPEVAGGNATLCDPLDVDSIHAGLLALLDSPSDTGVTATRRQWAAPFSYESAARQWEALLNRVAG
jgi:glycosyltransferase involved in cell wall biosynthesis